MTTASILYYETLLKLTRWQHFYSNIRTVYDYCLGPDNHQNNYFPWVYKRNDLQRRSGGALAELWRNFSDRRNDCFSLVLQTKWLLAKIWRSSGDDYSLGHGLWSIACTSEILTFVLEHWIRERRRSRSHTAKCCLNHCIINKSA